MDYIVKNLVEKGDNGQYIISKIQLLTMRVGGLRELEAAIFEFATENPNYTIAIEQLTEDFLEGSVRITWRKN